MSTSDDPTDVADDTIRKLLRADTIAVVGCSTIPGKAAHDVPKYLQEQGYRIVPVNPHAEEVLGETAYDRVSDVPEDVYIDVVDVFRPSEEVSGIVDDALARRDAAGDVDGLWLQLDIVDDKAAARAAAEGIAVVQDRCLKVEHGRLGD
ncbi:CoA-binding protein [Haloparvum sedimenti]|uniref:CoA-binding protein n=1 Tax=Haloparvum sedimenti TaxID=1678448 RepID=UPI00071E7A79|nr:CoA-binding protein [Haloparvum sedimenti]